MVNRPDKVITLSISDILISTLKHGSDFIIKGSESFLYNGSAFGYEVVIKERRPKKYRDPKLDQKLRLQRLRIESRMILSALNNNIHVPALISADLQSFTLELEKINGDNFGTFLSNSQSSNESTLTHNFLKEFGHMVAKLHNIEIIHGDLTPLNVLIRKDNTMFIIDFGLAFYSNEVKDKAMDLFILYGALKIYSHFDSLFEGFLEGYRIANDQVLIIDYFDKLTKKGRYK